MDISARASSLAVRPHRAIWVTSVRRGVRFDILALLDRPGDPTKDVTIRWPDEDSREAVRLGTIVITAIAKNEPCDESIFDPGNLADGIGLPPDEIFAARQTAYAISLSKRQE